MTLRSGSLRLLSVALLFVGLCAASCKETDISKVQKGISESQRVSGIVNRELDTAVVTGLISEQESVPMRAFLKKLDTNLQAASDVVAKIKELTPESRQNILNVMIPIADQLNTADLSALNIKNENVKKRVKLALLGFRTGLDAVRIVLE